ncbi:NRDE family protein [Oceanobacillus sp. Castelsardo]|uniref:NRDE family protein n=1 Tax=Oceanobacillus sp. Castelsardo TaxID=1851204 RepID=UPI000838C86C|nr:NRDE family protein [Oceanobacillus sp. Castelsardo]
MCLINFHFHDHPNYKLIVAANRDEFYQRPTAPASYWKDDPNILAGRDLLQMGTWFGITRGGRFAALTNYRDPDLPETGDFSRGEVVRSFLAGEQSPNEFLQSLKKNKEKYAGFNVLIGNGDELYHYNNILDETNEITPGTHGLSNATLDTPWPKVEKGKQMLQDYVTNHKKMEANELFRITSNSEQANDEDLPNTGVGMELERILSSLFITSPDYGTRSSTVLLIDKENNVTFNERTYENGKFQREKQYRFSID